MSRGKKLDIFIGAEIEDEWSLVEDTPKTKSKKQPLSPQKHQLFFSKEKRRGKTVTLVGEFFLEKVQMQTLLKKLKKSLGCGGSFKNGFIELQGDIKESVRPLLKDEGFSFKPKH